MLIAFELFGYEAVPYLQKHCQQDNKAAWKDYPEIWIFQLQSGYYGLYHDQTIVYSKYKTEYINRKAQE